MEVRDKVRSIAYDLNVGKITVVGVPDRPGIAAAIFSPLAKAAISVDTIVQNASIQGITDLTFPVVKGELARAMEVVRGISLGQTATQFCELPQRCRPPGALKASRRSSAFILPVGCELKRTAWLMACAPRKAVPLSARTLKR